MQNSQIITGHLESFLQYRSHKDFQRIDGQKISMRNEILLNGFCTAGGALASAHEFQAKMVVTAGMGESMPEGFPMIYRKFAAEKHFSFPQGSKT